MSYSSLSPLFTGGGATAMVQRTWPAPGPGELIMAVRANAICGTDRHQYLHGSDCVAGHEAAGVVVAAGPGTSRRVGDRGVIYFKQYCGRCRLCAAGHTSLCVDKPFSNGFDRDGGYGAYELISERQFFPIPADLPFGTATMLLDAMGTTGHAWARTLAFGHEIRSVYIAGAGPIGIGLLVMGRLLLGESADFYISDLSPWRRSYAASFGAIPLDASGDDLGLPGPVDVSFDSTGKKVARQRAIDVLDTRGIFVVVGGQEGFSFDDVGTELLPRELSIIGSEYFDYAEFDDNLARLQANRPVIERMITHTFDVSELDTAFQAFFAGETGKVVITRDGAE